MKLSKEEQRAVDDLQRIAKNWPKSLWLFSANSSLCVMKKKNGENATLPNGSFDRSLAVAYIDIENDGGDF